MTNHNFGEKFYQVQYELLTKTMRERDLKIVELQKESAVLKERLNELSFFENFLVSAQQFFGLVLKTKNQIR